MTQPVAGPNANRPNSGLMTAEQVAERWQVEKSQVYRLAKGGRLPTVRLGRYLRFRLDELERFEREGGVAVE